MNTELSHSSSDEDANELIDERDFSYHTHAYMLWFDDDMAFIEKNF